uniref:Uncharacterized protein n=1 Tax=Pinguiococcus pyrenoidosus TaxID=172671 RepID=A0A7R9YCA4_9STRA|mmetsp:Transcript_18161/g.68843  ORF Transcript_18161/g.68843 Transcript_18161/m.68843 type:complete len:503 (+) Transcript_18161:72-1580(+)|eukprot:scaffold7351_cov259-Pinguiococcus_pyrenoidosus.AAC.24
MEALSQALSDYRPESAWEAVVLVAVLCVVLRAVLTLVDFALHPKAPPRSNGIFPVLSNAIGFASHPVKFIEKRFRQSGPVFTCSFGAVNLTFLIGPDASAPFYKAKDDQLDQGQVYGFMTPVFGRDVVYDAPLVKRQHQIRQTAVALRSSRLEQYVPMIVKETVQFTKAWGNEGSLDVLTDLSVLTIMTASRCLHGDDVRENMFDEVSRLYHDLDKGITPLSFFWPTAPTAAHAKRDAARVEMMRLFTRALEKRDAESTEEQQTKTDLLQVYKDMVYKDGSKNTPHHVTGMLIALLFAGQHTSSITSTWVTIYLAHNPDIQQRCREEVQAALTAAAGTGKEDADVSFEAIQHMELLGSCVKEVLRLHPPLIMLMRKAIADIPVDLGKGEPKYVIPKGDIVIACPAVSQRLESVFTEPDKFDPDRFMPPREEHAKKPYSFMGFGGGIHQCIGQQFGLVQVKTIVSYLLLNFEFEAVDPVPECNYEAMVVGPKDGTHVKYRRRI